MKLVTSKILWLSPAAAATTERRVNTEHAAVNAAANATPEMQARRATIAATAVAIDTYPAGRDICIYCGHDTTYARIGYDCSWCGGN